jgi:ParB family chromosome partitioning protein
MLPETIKMMLAAGELSAGHARALLAAPEAQRVQLAQRAAAESLTVRTLERLAGAVTTPRSKAQRGLRDLSPDEHAFETRLRERFGTHVALVRYGRGGRIELRFQTDDELLRLGDLLLPEET